jgi:hypothetical protein
MLGLGSCHSPKISLASALETEPAMMTSWPWTQFTGVATLRWAVNCSESMTRSTSSKLRQVVKELPGPTRSTAGALLTIQLGWNLLGVAYSIPCSLNDLSG